MSGVNIVELERLARAATPGPWLESLGGREEQIVVTNLWTMRVVAPHPTNQSSNHANIAFIAAANPETVLALIEEIRTLSKG